jgi:RNA polymerase sigma-70 factor, ECF subfamily
MEVGNIYAQFSQSLLAYIRSKIRSKEDAEDILQNVFTKIAANVNSLSEKQKIQNWLFTVTRNAIIDYYRANASKPTSVQDDGIADKFVHEETNDPTGGLDACINSMIDLLPPDYKRIIIDSELRGISQKDLAKKYDMAYPSMRSRVQRGRERLKQLFYNCCHIRTDSLGNIMEATGKDDCGSPCEPCND